MGRIAYYVLRIFGCLLLAGCSAQTEKIVALTFDDGPSPYTEQILQTLEEKEVRATFFLIGQQVEKFPILAKQIQDAGHGIGGHSYDWETLAFKKWKTVEQKLNRMDATFAQAGITNVTLFRPPNGLLSLGQKKKIGTRGFEVVLGDVVPGDWKEIDAETICERVLKKVRAGSIIVLHDGGGDRSETAKALPMIIDLLEEQGYSFLTVRELIRNECRKNNE